MLTNRELRVLPEQRKQLIHPLWHHRKPVPGEEKLNCTTARNLTRAFETFNRLLALVVAVFVAPPLHFLCYVTSMRLGFENFQKQTKPSRWPSTMWRSTGSSVPKRA
jgi:hypothetical protein